MSTLVLYLSREGQTRKIAEAVVAELAAAGQTATACELTQVSSEALAAASQIVVGASIHYGHLPKALYAFIECHQQRLATTANAFFCVNLTARKPGKDTPAGSVYVRTFLKRSPWHPQRLAVFAGALVYSRYRWYDRMMIRFIMWLTKGPTDTRVDLELTDWDKVKAFAKSLVG